MNTYSQNTQGGPQTLRIIHGALMMGMTLFFLVTLYLHANDMFFSMDPNVEVRDHSMFFYTVPAIVLISYTVSIMMARSMPISSKNEYYRRFQQVMTRHIVRIAPIEGAGLFIIVSFLLTGTLSF